MGELPTTELTQFRMVDEAGLKKFAALGEAKFKRFASHFDDKGLKELSKMDMANFTQPRTTAAALDEAGGHSFGKHGAHTTPGQHETRLRTGVAPDGSVGTLPEASGKFVSDEVQVEAARLADEQLINEALNAKGTKFKEKVELVVAIHDSGISYKLDPTGRLTEASTSTAKAVYKLKDGPDGKRYVLYTLYPEL